MNSHVFQISNFSISRSSFINANQLAAFRCRFFEYCYNLSEDERLRVIRQFIDECLPKGMFTLVGMDKVRYNGGFQAWLSEWTDRLHSLCTNVSVDKPLECFGSSYNRLKEMIDNPLQVQARFYLSDDIENDKCESAADFMRMVSSMHEGDFLYIGAVLGYYA